MDGSTILSQSILWLCHAFVASDFVARRAFVSSDFGRKIIRHFNCFRMKIDLKDYFTVLKTKIR